MDYTDNTEKTKNPFSAISAKIHKNDDTSGQNIAQIAGMAAVILFAFGIAAGLIIFVHYLFTPKPDTLTVENIKWRYSTEIERYKTLHESDWTLPADARLGYTQQEIYTYEQVLDHYETKTEVETREIVDHYEEYVSGYKDLGNGYAEEITSTRPVYKTETYTETYEEPIYRTEPVYRTKYYYDIDRWVTDRTVSSTGNNHNTYWEDIDIPDSKERKGASSETYTIEAVNKKGVTKTYTLKKADWMETNPGDILEVMVSPGGIIEILERNGVAVETETTDETAMIEFPLPHRQRGTTA